MGRPAKDQGDYGDDVGIVDMARVDQFGKNSSKYYHTGVVQAHGRWFAYYEWDRISGGKSWEGRRPANFWFVECDSEEEARATFKKKTDSKNMKRLVEKKVGGETIWAPKPGKDGYIIQSLATRERGLPDAYTIKDATGISESKKSKKTSKKSTKPSGKTFQPQVIDLARSLVGGVQSYARAASAATGVTPTMESITKVRDKFLPAAMQRIVEISKTNPKQSKEKDDVYDERLLNLQLDDDDMKDISKVVAVLVPRVIPRGRGGGAKSIILSSGNILTIQQDLDTFESSLTSEDFDVEEQDTSINPDTMLNAQLIWVDPTSTKGRWLENVYRSMSNNRHSYMRGRIVVKNIFEVARPDRDSKFIASVKAVAKKREHVRIDNRAHLQPGTRDDVSDISDVYARANVYLGIHGTRSVNVAPIMQTDLRLPRSLPGAQITGAAFGHGIYFATDFRKSYGYTGHGNSYWGSGGQITGRGFFMFLNDVIMGDAYMARGCGSWGSPPGGKDSVCAFPGRNFVSSLANDEHIIFDPTYQRIRYIIEADLQ